VRGSLRREAQPEDPRRRVMESASDPAGLYLHIPFCLRKCGYCDFYSITDRRLQPAFIEALVRDLRATGFPGIAADTLYFGGGTPSLLSPAAIGRLVETVSRVFRLTSDAEITLEVNPGTATPSHFSQYRAAGINRIHIGVQSFRDEVLSFLGRCHTALDARRTVVWAREAGFENVGLDLIYGIPGQTKAAWTQELASALALFPSHLSCYLLSFERGTPLERQLRAGAFRSMPESDTAALFLLTREILTAASFDPYEISNFAKDKKTRSRHNRKYWCHAPYLGFGPAAHSFMSPERWWNLRDAGAYMDRIQKGKNPEEERETLSREQLMMEAIFLGLRQLEGLEIAAFERRFGIDFTRRFSPLIEELASTGHLTIEAGRCALTPYGMLLSDAISARFAALI
jgi:putative oxygen-independent coproporphyrinogen III oxidase